MPFYDTASKTLTPHIYIHIYTKQILDLNFLIREQYEALKQKEKTKKVGKFDGTSGMQFRSRSMQDFQKGREAGTLNYNMVSF